MDIYGRPDTFTGILIGVFGLGAAFTAALLVTRMRASFRSISLAMTGLGLAIITFGMSAGATVGLATLFVGGIMYMISISLATTLMQLDVAEAHRGRVMALWGVAFLGARPAASLLDGSVATIANLRVAAFVMAIPALAGAVFIARRRRRRRSRPT